MKVLVIESCASPESAICESLRRQDYRVDLARDGREAISRVASQAYDVIVLDLVLSNDSSLLVLHEMRELNPQSKILVLSSRGQIRDRVTALIQGADDYLLEPFTAESLRTRIRSLAGQRGETAARHARNSGAEAKNLGLDQLLDGLRDLCCTENPAIDLVFCEVRLPCLLAEVKSHLQETASDHQLSIRLPQTNLPGILVDANWMKYLLLNLFSYLLSQSATDSAINLEFRSDREFGELRLVSSIAGAAVCISPSTPPGNTEITANCAETGPGSRLALARFCAQCLNLEMRAAVSDDKRLQIRISGIRII